MKIVRVIVSTIFLIIGGVLLAGVTGAVMGMSNPMGNFLWKSYSYAAFGAPPLFFWIFGVLLFGKMKRYRFVVPVMLVLPLLSFAVAFRIMLWQPPAAFPPFWNTVQLFGKTAAVVFWFFAGSALTVCAAILHALWSGVSHAEQTESTEQPAHYATKSDAQSIKDMFTRNYMRLKNALNNNRSPQLPASPPEKKAAENTTQSPHTPAPPQFENPPPRPVYADSRTYDNADVHTHAKNHAGYRYTPEVRMTSAEHERYMLIFNRSKLHNDVSLQISKEFEEENLRDAVPLGAEGYSSYVSNDDEILHEGTYGSEVEHSHRSTPLSSYETLPQHEYVGAGTSSENHTTADETHTHGAKSYDAAASYGVNVDDESHVDEETRKKKLSLTNLYNNTYDPQFENNPPSENFHSCHGSDNEQYNTYRSSSEADENYRGDWSDDERDVSDDDYSFNDTDYTQNEEQQHYTRPNITMHNPPVAGSQTSHEFEIPEVDGFALREKPEPAPKPKKRVKYSIPIHGVLDPPTEENTDNEEDTKKVAQKLEQTLREFSIDAKVVSYCRGPVVTMFEILPAPGVRLNRIVALSDNIALRLAAASIRIVAPIPGKEAVGIEVPNENREMVALAELISHKQFYNKENALPVVLGKDVQANVRVADLSRMPHLLIAGATGSGKSVCVNTLLCSLLFRCSPDDLKFILIDPKTVELSFYNNIAHLLTPVIDNPERSVQALRWCVEEMERRYRQLGAHGVREIRSYNTKLSGRGAAKSARMPYIVIVIDEFADLMLTCGKEIETLVSRIAAKSRAVGMHLALATQRPSTDVITGIIKANIPSRIAFMVASKTDSRIILDQNGADKLLGRGDMLFSSANDLSPVRIQGAFLSEEEVAKVVGVVREIGGEPEYLDEDELFPRSEESQDGYDSLNDPLWDEAVSEVRDASKASASYLQRRFRIGYNRAARLIDSMEEQGIIGPQQGSKPRSVIA